MRTMTNLMIRPAEPDDALTVFGPLTQFVCNFLAAAWTLTDEVLAI